MAFVAKTHKVPHLVLIFEICVSRKNMMHTLRIDSLTIRQAVLTFVFVSDQCVRSDPQPLFIFVKLISFFHLSFLKGVSARLQSSGAFLLTRCITRRAGYLSSIHAMNQKKATSHRSCTSADAAHRRSIGSSHFREKRKKRGSLFRALSAIL